jgi:hypothetical protein
LLAQTTPGEYHVAVARKRRHVAHGARIGINYEGSNEKKYLLVEVLAIYTGEEIQTLNAHRRKGGSEYSQQE